jgi:hypothetical protein
MGLQLRRRDHSAIEQREGIRIVLHVEYLFLAEKLSIHIHPTVEAFFVNDAEVVALIHADNVNAQLCI